MPSHIHVLDGSQASWSPDGKKMVFVRIEDPSKAKDTLCTIDIDGSNFKTHCNWGLDPKYAPDGNKILCSCIGKLKMVNPHADHIENYGELQELTSKSISIGQFQWSPDGRKVAFIAHDNHDSSGLYVINPDGTELQCLIKDDKWRRQHLSWASDSSRIVCGGEGVELFDINNGSYQILFSHGLYPSWNPHQDTIAFHTYSGIYAASEHPELPYGIHLFNINTQQLRTKTITNGHIKSNQNPLSWSPDGMYLAFALSYDKGWFSKRENAVCLLNTSENSIRELVKGNHARDSSISWSPDSLKIAICLTPDFYTQIIDI